MDYSTVIKDYSKGIKYIYFAGSPGSPGSPYFVPLVPVAFVALAEICGEPREHGEHWWNNLNNKYIEVKKEHYTNLICVYSSSNDKVLKELDVKLKLKEIEGDF